MRTHYDNLHVSEKASPEVIKGAYKALAQKWHPDKHPNQREKAERYFKIITRAFEVLSDPRARAEYDAWLAEQRGAAESARESPKADRTNAQAAAREDGRRAGIAGESQSTCPYSGDLASTWQQGFQAGKARRQQMAEAWEDGKGSHAQGFTLKDCPYRDEDLAQAWQEGFRSFTQEVKPIEQPVSVKKAAVLLWLVIAAGLIKGLIQLLDASESAISNAIFLVIILAFIGYLVSEIADGKNWARITFLLLFIGGSYIELLLWSEAGFPYAGFTSWLTTFQVGAQVAALIMLFSSSARPWFAADTPARPQPAHTSHTPPKRPKTQEQSTQAESDPVSELRTRFFLAFNNATKLSEPSQISVGHSINMANSVFRRKFSGIEEFQSLSEGARSAYIIKMIAFETSLQMKNNDSNEVLGFSLFRMYIEAASLNDLALFREFGTRIADLSAKADIVFGGAFS